MTKDDFVDKTKSSHHNLVLIGNCFQSHLRALILHCHKSADGTGCKTLEAKTVLQVSHKQLFLSWTEVNNSLLSLCRCCSVRRRWQYQLQADLLQSALFLLVLFSPHIQYQVTVKKMITNYLISYHYPVECKILFSLFKSRVHLEQLHGGVVSRLLLTLKLLKNNVHFLNYKCDFFLKQPWRQTMFLIHRRRGWQFFFLQRPPFGSTEQQSPITYYRQIWNWAHNSTTPNFKRISSLRVVYIHKATITWF